MLRNRLRLLVCPVKYLIFLTTFSLYVSEAVGQDIPEIGPQFSLTSAHIEEQLRDNRQSVEDALQSSYATLQSLIAINPETGLQAAYDLDAQSGIAERIGRTSEAQSEFIENYAGLMQLRTANLFDLWGDRSENRAMVFMRTGSLFDVPALPPVDADDQDAVIPVPLHDYFPGFDVSTSGFFAQSQSQP